MLTESVRNITRLHTDGSARYILALDPFLKKILPIDTETPTTGRRQTVLEPDDNSLQPA
jgi:hypothetical protein